MPYNADVCLEPAFLWNDKLPCGRSLSFGSHSHQLKIFVSTLSTNSGFGVLLSSIWSKNSVFSPIKLHRIITLMVTVLVVPCMHADWSFSDYFLSAWCLQMSTLANVTSSGQRIFVQSSAVQPLCSIANACRFFFCARDSKGAMIALFDKIWCFLDFVLNVTSDISPFWLPNPLIGIASDLSPLCILDQTACGERDQGRVVKPIARVLFILRVVTMIEDLRGCVVREIYIRRSFRRMYFRGLSLKRPIFLAIGIRWSFAGLVNNQIARNQE